MIVFSGIYILAAVTLYRLHLGDVSLVYANILNLSARIIYSLYFISSFFSRHGALDVLEWNSVLPRWPLLLMSGLSVAAISTSTGLSSAVELLNDGGTADILSLPVAMHIVLGGFMASACLIVWWMSSGQHLSVPSRAKSE